MIEEHNTVVKDHPNTKAIIIAMDIKCNEQNISQDIESNMTIAIKVIFINKEIKRDIMNLIIQTKTEKGFNSKSLATDSQEIDNKNIQANKTSHFS